MNTTTKIGLSKVSSVYSGRDGACCCGCAGKHTYASAHVKWASKNRGYEVTDDEVSDRTVKLIVGKIEKAEIEHMAHDFVSAVVGKRLYIAYLVH